MASRLLNQYKQKIKDFKLVPSGGGCFEFSINGEVLYSKLKTGEFPAEEAIEQLVQSRL